MNENQKQKAESLFLNTEKSQKEIASQLGVDPKTLYRWIKEGHWQQLKSATRRMPSVLVENIYEQLDDLNYSISQRDRGQRHPTKDESLTISRLTNCINKMQKQTSQGQNIQFMMNFIDYVQPINNDLAQLLTHYGSAFLNGSQIQGFHPYDIEYNNATQSAEEAPSLFLGKVPEGGKGPLASDYNPNQLELPFPPIGHKSGIENNSEIPTQQPENQSEQQQTPETKMPEMPENNFPENRASEEAPPMSNNTSLSGACPATSGREGRDEAPLAQDNPPDNAPTLNETTDDEDTPDFSDPNLMIKAYMREKGIPLPEDTQLFSIGEKIFSMRVDNKKKKR